MQQDRALKSKILHAAGRSHEVTDEGYTESLPWLKQDKNTGRNVFMSSCMVTEEDFSSAFLEQKLRNLYYLMTS